MPPPTNWHDVETSGYFHYLQPTGLAAITPDVGTVDEHPTLGLVFLYPAKAPAR